MKIYTSYFANYRNFPKGTKAVSIARFNPPYWAGEEYKKLAPDKWLLQEYKNAEITQDEFAERYREQLETLDKDQVIEELRRLNGGRAVILVCYEKTGEFCHRTLAGEWLGAEEIVQENLEENEA